MSRILAIGGGGFQMEDEPSPIDDYLLALTGKASPRLCLLSTPSGDRSDDIDRFYVAYSRRACRPSHVAFFGRTPRQGAVPLAQASAHLLAQDVVFVSGGNTRAAIAVWREWGLDRVLKEVLDRGIVLAGMSAGAMCWFEQALTDTYWEPSYAPIPGLGFLTGGCRVHYNDGEDQRGRLHTALLAGAVPDTIAITDHAAVLFRDRAVERVVTWRAGAAAYRVYRDGKTLREEAFPSELIAPATNS
jgi:peptidase E